MAANENPLPFTSRGTLRPAVELEAIAGNLEPQRLQLWNDLVAAARECEQAEAHAKACTDATAAAVRAANEVRADQVRAARTKLAAALSAFVNGGPKWTTVDAARDFQRTAFAERKARAEGRLPPRRNNGIGPSRVDQMAAAYAGGGYGAKRGGGRAYARGAYSSAQAADLNAQPARAAKLPSEQ
jgi:hypothetical protein